MNRRLKVLAVLPGFIPSTIIGVVQPLLDLQAQGKIEFRATLDLLPGSARVEWADAVVFSRNVEMKHRRALDAAIRREIPVIYELDDNLFEVTGESDITEYHRAPERQAMLAEYVRRANLVRVYADPVYERCVALNPNTLKVKAPVDWRVIRAGHKSDKVKIVYCTSRASDELWQKFWPGLNRILLEFPDAVEMYFWGPQLPVKRLPNVHFLRPVFDYKRFMRLFSEKGFDIGLAPLLDDTFHRSKTNNKFREYGVTKIAGIYSAVNVYSDWVEDGKTGLLVGDKEEDWYQALRRLILDRELREQIQEQAYIFVRQNFSPEEFSDTWLKHLEHVLSRNQRPSMPVKQISDQNHDIGQARGGKLAFLQRVLKRLLRLLKEPPQQARRLLGWLIFNIWALVRVNLLRRI